MEKEKDKQPKAKKAYYSASPKLGDGGPSKLRLAFNKGITYFLVIAAGVLFYFALLRLEILSDAAGKIFGVLKPVIYGCAIAYLLNPVVRKVDQYLVPKLEKKMTEEKARKISRAAGILVVLILLVLLIITLLNLLIPELYSSIRNLVFTLPRQLNGIVDSLSSITLDDSTISVFLKTVLEEGTQMLQNWLRTELLPKTNEIMTNLTEGVFNILSEIFNALIGVIVSVYILFSKELFARQSKKLVYACLDPKRANLILHLATKSNEVFGGFIIGKIIDSAIIGVLCFFGLTLLKMPYVVLVSVIVGVTNVIPFFGPYIGAIPSAILILLADPIKGLYFALFILLLQQFDGNILGPKILGNSTGLSAFWVIVSILLGGGLFGFVGMVMGVPTFALLYYIVEMVMNSRLERKKLPLSSDQYDPECFVDDDGIYHDSEEYVKPEKKLDTEERKGE